ncbi:MAG: succinate dehydrogenase iron-sulfur subunit [Chloroflexi bacterium]|nr:succinate dehydrogenase iron-sulfur subunit [Chloroflexota bacterium]
MQVSFKVRRFDPEAGKPPYYDQYTLDVPDYFTVLDALLQVRDEVDGSLALRCSCRSAICGSCAMHINGHAHLACKSRIQNFASKTGEIVVEPMGNMPVIKDLVVEMKPFWSKVQAVTPWLIPEGPPPQREYVVPNSAMLELAGVMNCIMCGCCVSDCTVLTVDKSFLAPAALAKAYRFVADPRDGVSEERLRELSKRSGIWDCTRCFECVQQCPKNVAPMERILALRAKAMEVGFTNNIGSRHSESIARSVKHSGWLDELRVPIESAGLFNIKALIGYIPVGFRALVKGKVPPIIHRPRPGADSVKRIFEKLEVRK